MSLDPLQKIWQSRQLDIPVEQIMKQAKSRQRRMFWLMALDILSWLAIVIFAAWHIHLNEKSHSFTVGLFAIITVSIMVGYALWLRTSTWGMDTLDITSTLKLSIARCEAGVQMGLVSTVFCFVVAVGILIISLIYPENFKEKMVFAYTWSFGWCIAIYAGHRWYSKLQKKKIAHFRSLLEQLQKEKP